jgi:hypothetical protein
MPFGLWVCLRPVAHRPHLLLNEQPPIDICLKSLQTPVKKEISLMNEKNYIFPIFWAILIDFKNSNK